MLKKGFSVIDINDYKSFFFEQKIVFYVVMLGESMIIIGGGGVGKFYFIGMIERYYRNIVFCVLIGIVVVNIGGIMFDSFMGFGGCFFDVVQVRCV